MYHRERNNERLRVRGTRFLKYAYLIIQKLLRIYYYYKLYDIHLKENAQ